MSATISSQVVPLPRGCKRKRRGTCFISQPASGQNSLVQRAGRPADRQRADTGPQVSTNDMPVTAKNGDGGFGAKRGVEAGLLSFQHHRVDDILVALSAERSGSRQHFKGNHPKGVHCRGKNKNQNKTTQKNKKRESVAAPSLPLSPCVLLVRKQPKHKHKQAHTSHNYSAPSTDCARSTAAGSSVVVSEVV